MDTQAHLQGLSQEVALKRLQTEGRNELSRGKRYTGLNILLDVLKEPMFLLLLISSFVYLLLGDSREAFMLGSMIFLVIGITFYQRNRTEHTLASLRELSSPRALVIRDAMPLRIPGYEVVREDLVVLSEGDRIPADGVLSSGFGLSVDESLLTGESIPVVKDPADSQAARLYAGTLVVQGQGIMTVEAVGQHTTLGNIGRSLENLGGESTALQKEVAQLVRLFAGWGLLLCLTVLFIYGFVKGSWLSGLLAGLTLAMSVLPEELPMILTVFLALGAWRIAKNHVLTRRTHAIEALGSATVLCTDKTGTLTLNKMAIARLATLEEGELDLGGSSHAAGFELAPFQALMTYACWASQQAGYDPMDMAAIELAQRYVAASDLYPFRCKEAQKVYPLSKSLLAVTIVWPDKKGSYRIAMKGAPESVISACKLEVKQKADVLEITKKMGAEGLRVLAVAKGHWESDTLPESPESFPLRFVGLLGYMDPIRPTVPEAVQACYSAGIRVLMITGDYPETAMGIAKAIGLRNFDKLLTGAELHQMTDEALMEQVKTVNTYARMLPEHKLRLVNALKRNQEIVAMTGDGVNDAPALKAAHIGIAMGKRGTDVAREAADLVLLDDDFSSIVDAIRQGRRIFENLRKAMAYIFSTHVPIAGMAVLPVIFNWPLVLFPAHIALIQMIIDPACSVAFEAEMADVNVMDQPPRPSRELLFNQKILMQAVFQGSVSFLLTLSVYGVALWQRYGEADARTMGFVTLLVSNLMLISTNLAGQAPILSAPFLKNKAYWWLMGLTTVILCLLLTVTSLQALFHFSSLHIIDYAICIIAALLCLILLEFPKYFKPRA